MKLRSIIAGSAVIALSAPSLALAQSESDGSGGGITVGAPVPSYLELALSQPKSGFASFAKAKAYDTSIGAQVTATDAPIQLSVADGDVTSGAKRGHLSVGAKRLPSPLEAKVGAGAFQPLDASVDPLLTKWTQASSHAGATIKLRQKVAGKATGAYRKLVLVTLSTATP